MISWAAMDRIVETQMASNAISRKLFARRPVRSKARVLSDEELVAKLRSFDIDLDRTMLEGLCEQVFSAEEIAESLIKQSIFKNKREAIESDWIWICLVVLWERWFPDKPSFEQLDDKMQNGYDLLTSQGTVAGCQMWLSAWRDVLCILDKTGMQSIKELDERFKGTQSLFNWIQDLESELWNAGLEDQQFLTARISVCEEALNRFCSDSRLVTENQRRAIAESYFKLGETGKADTLFGEWLQSDPCWGWGWIGWSDCYHFGQTQSEMLERAEQILQEGLSIVGVRDRSDLLDRLADFYDEQGRSSEAKELRTQIRTSADGRQATPRVDSFDSIFGKRNSYQEPSFLSNAGTMQHGAFLPVAAREQKAGRNAPCPCGSGKKFKKCCGRGLWMP